MEFCLTFLRLLAHGEFSVTSSLSSGQKLILALRSQDDFSWYATFFVPLLPFFPLTLLDCRGQTRKIVGEAAETSHGDKDGDFDSSHIVMKRWADFERDRRYRSGNHSRDSTFESVVRSGSPHRETSNRYSVISSSETFASGSGGPGGSSDAIFRRSSPGGVSNGHSTSEGTHGPRVPSQLELPAPLASQSGHGPPDFDQRSDLPPAPYDYDQKALPGVVSTYEYPRYAEQGYDSDELEREGILQSPVAQSPTFDTATFPSRTYTRPERENPFTAEPETLVQHPGRPMSHTPAHVRSDSSSSNSSSNPFAPPHTNHRRGVSLVDAGPVPGSKGFRTVQRARRTSQGPGAPAAPSSARSRNSLATDASVPTSPEVLHSPTSSHVPSLPPGAAPPRHSSASFSP